MVWHVLFQSLICSCSLYFPSSQSITAQTLWNGFSYFSGVCTKRPFYKHSQDCNERRISFGGAALIGLPSRNLWDFRHLQARHSMAMYGLLRPCISSTIYCALFSKSICSDSWSILNISESYQGTITCPIMSHHIKTRSNHVMSCPFIIQGPYSLQHPCLKPWRIYDMWIWCAPCQYTVVTPLAFRPPPFYRAYQGYYIEFLKWQEKVATGREIVSGMWFLWCEPCSCVLSCARCYSWASLACKHELTATLCAELCKKYVQQTMDKHIYWVSSKCCLQVVLGAKNTILQNKPLIWVENEAYFDDPPNRTFVESWPRVLLHHAVRLQGYIMLHTYSYVRIVRLCETFFANGYSWFGESD